MRYLDFCLFFNFELIRLSTSTFLDDLTETQGRLQTRDQFCFSRKALDSVAKTLPKTSRGKGPHTSRLPLSASSHTIPLLASNLTIPLLPFSHAIPPLSASSHTIPLSASSLSSPQLFHLCPQLLFSTSSSACSTLASLRVSLLLQACWIGEITNLRKSFAITSTFFGFNICTYMRYIH